MAEKRFVDTSLLVYAHDRGGGRKHDLARELIERLWVERSGVVSTQVLQELYVNLRRKTARPLSLEAARELVEDYLRWEVVINDGASLLRATEVEDRYGISFWDALIVQAAEQSGARVLYSEDLSHGQRYGSVEVVDPLRDGP